MVLVGNPRPASRTHAVAERAARAVAPDAVPETVDLTGFADRLLGRDPDPVLDEAVSRVTSADLLVVASPTYKGTYTGLLKAFLDRVPSLTGVTALPLLVMGSPRHALAVEVHLRPLLVELGATVPTPGLAVVEADIVRLDEVLAAWAVRLPEAVR
ncbi:NAD(P)H-dependent oxidoreductase [Actinoallomurus rhizosphaericola]|uniref:NAD(P)H-dependent oxidoreductase n=1 Tax=Actinoallomurus rhizosphaericola TaxID=2952536 RepID=UPI00209046D4|nr:NAD(P)H-dependent oxidoreductase [Actinoallomurus rhizosphaericola]MCO5994045.1 NAD(P)H-dependent oxidoreductase [Actinoallomurus rhizosphaericola]